MEITQTEHSELVEYTEYLVSAPEAEFGMVATVREGRLIVAHEDANGTAVVDIDVTKVEFAAQLLVAVAADQEVVAEDPPPEEPAP